MGLIGANQDQSIYKGPHWTIQNHTRPCVTVLDHKGPCMTTYISDQMETHKIKLDYTRQIRTDKDYTEQYRTNLDHIGPRAKDQSEPHGTTGDHTGPCRTN